MDKLNVLKEQIRLSNPIEEVIGEKIRLDRNHKSLCPFHAEKTSSFSVNIKEQYFHCFGCGAGGDVFTFVMLDHHVQFCEALEYLAQKKGIALPTNKIDFESEQKKRDIQLALNEASCLYQKNLSVDVREYLKNRGLTDETIDKAKIGYCDGKSKFTMDKGCLINAGLIYENGCEYFQGFITFPHLYHGRVVYMSGRGYPEKKHKKLEKEKVALTYLYNQEALREEMVLMGEGEIDTLTLLQNGFNACGVLGAGSFQEEWIDKFRNCETVYLCLDADEAGREGSLRIAELFGEKAKIVNLPDGLDVNDYFKDYSKEDFDILLSSAKTLISHKIDAIPVDVSKTSLPALLEPILKKLSLLDDASLEAYLNYEIKSRFGLKDPDIKAYRKLIKKYHEANSKSLNVDSDMASVYTADFEGLVDLVEYENKPAFLVKKENKLEIIPQFEKEGKLYLPPPKEQIPWLLPRGEEVVKFYELGKVLPSEEGDAALYDDLLNYHKGISELPNEGHYDLFVAWDMHTYLLDNFQYSPILCLFAVPERGKSRTGKGLIHVAYRGIHVESLRDAYLVRVAQDLNASLFFDVKDIWRKAEKNESEDILLHRFEKGAKVPRVIYPERGAYKDIVYYSIFGPTIIATNEAVHQILETRAISLNMPETSRRFENAVTPQIALTLKERLLAFRARHMESSLPDILKPASGRLGDILKPLQQIICLVKPEREPSFLKLIKELESGRLLEKAMSLEAQILKVIIGLEVSVMRDLLPVKSITDEFNKGKAERYQITYQKVGRRLSAMGFDKSSLGDGASAIVWNKTLIERMQSCFGLGKTSETSESSETPVDWS